MTHPGCRASAVTSAGVASWIGRFGLTGLLGATILLGATVAGCKKEKARTEIVIGLATDLMAPLPLTNVHLEVTRLPDETQIGAQDFPISGKVDNVYELPGTYAVYSAGGTPDRLRVRLDAQDNNGATLVVRTAVLSLVPGRTLFVRLGVITACEGMNDCPDGQTCIDGRCASEDIDSTRLPDYTPGAETQIACAGGATFVDTSTRKPLTVTGLACADGGTCQEGVCLSPPATPDGGAGGVGGSAATGGHGGAAGAGGAGGLGGADVVGRPAAPVVTYDLVSSLNPDRTGLAVLTAVDPMGTSGFQSDTVLGATRTVWAFNGDDSTPMGGEAGLTFDPRGILVHPASYSIDMVAALTMRDGGWRRLVDVQNRQSDNGFYVDPSNNLDIYPVSGSTGAFTTDEYHHIALTVDDGGAAATGDAGTGQGMSTVRAYLDGVAQFAALTPEMNLDFDLTDNPNMLLGFFLDNVVLGGQGEWSPGKVAIIRLWDGVLTQSQVVALAADPFTPRR